MDCREYQEQEAERKAEEQGRGGRGGQAATKNMGRMITKLVLTICFKHT